MFLRLLEPLASDLLIGGAFFSKYHKSGYLELFTYVFADRPICFSTCRRKMETVDELSGKPLSRGRHCGFFAGNI